MDDVDSTLTAGVLSGGWGHLQAEGHYDAALILSVALCLWLVDKASLRSPKVAAFLANIYGGMVIVSLAGKLT